jgi:hypothetical protein
MRPSISGWQRDAIKNPLPVTQHPEGVYQHTRRLALYPHGALRSREAYPSQRSSLQGLLPYRSSYQEALGLHTLRLISIYGAQALCCQEEPPDRQTACRTPSS